MELSATTNSAGYPLAVTGLMATYVTPDVRYQYMEKYSISKKIVKFMLRRNALKALKFPSFVSPANICISDEHQIHHRLTSSSNMSLSMLVGGKKSSSSDGHSSLSTNGVTLPEWSKPLCTHVSVPLPLFFSSTVLGVLHNGKIKMYWL